MKQLELANHIEAIAPLEIGEAWDNQGFMYRSGKNSIKKMLISLDFNEAVAEEAIELKVDFVLTHHPYIFKPLTHLDAQDKSQKGFLNLIRHNISLYASHTSFDITKGGNSDFIMGLLGLKPEENKSIPPIGRMGYLPVKMPLKKWIQQIKDHLDIDEPIKFVGNPDKLIYSVGVTTGSGSDLIKAFHLAGCDAYITGDLKFHDGQLGETLGMALIDGTHYHTEKFFSQNMKAHLKKRGVNIEIIQSKLHSNPFDFA